MTRRSGVLCLLAFLICVGGHSDGLQWQDENQQISQEQQHPSQAGVASGSVPFADAHQGWTDQLTQGVEGAATTAAQTWEANQVTDEPSIQSEHRHDSPPYELQQQQPPQSAAEAAVQEHSEGQVDTAVTSGDTAAAADGSAYQYEMYLWWLKLQEQQLDLEPFWQWLPHQPRQQQQQQQQQEEQQELQQQEQQQQPYDAVEPSSHLDLRSPDFSDAVISSSTEAECSIGGTCPVPAYEHLNAVREAAHLSNPAEEPLPSAAEPLLHQYYGQAQQDGPDWQMPGGSELMPGNSGLIPQLEQQQQDEAGQQQHEPLGGLDDSEGIQAGHGADVGHQQQEEPKQQAEHKQQAEASQPLSDWSLHTIVDPVAFAVQAQAMVTAQGLPDAKATGEGQVTAEAQSGSHMQSAFFSEAQGSAAVSATEAQGSAAVSATEAQGNAAASATEAQGSAAVSATEAQRNAAASATEAQGNAATSATETLTTSGENFAAAEGSATAAGSGNGAAAAASVSGTDVEAAALTAVAVEAAGRGPSAASSPATVSAGDDGTGGKASSEATRVAVQEAADAAEATRLDPLRGMTVADVQNKLQEAQRLLFANSSRRNPAAGLQQLRELHELVEAALPSSPTMRVRFVPKDTLGDSSPSAAAQKGASQSPAPRPLGLEVAESRHSGLHAAAAATFQLAALQASGVMPPDQLPSDPLDALVAMHQAARAGSMEALMALADAHAQGIGVPASCPRGFLFAKLAATYLTQEVEREQRYASPLAPVSLRDRFTDGSYVAAEDAENGAHVISLEEDLAFRGNTDAMRRMAYRRLVGRGMEADPEGAFHDFQAAAVQGDPYAIFNIGYMYLRGLHVPQNYTAAREQFQKAAEKGLPSAHNGLGVLAWNGQGMPQNLTAARESFERGAALNNSDSVYNLATMHFHGAGTIVNHSLALDLFKRALELGHWRAPYMLALAYESGAGAEVNCTRALQYLRVLFAERGTWGQQLTAAVKLLDAGDARGALLTYVTVAEQGSASASANAAWLLRRRAGYSGPDADHLAVKYFQRAAKQGHTSSMVELAHMMLAAAPAVASSAAVTTAVGADSGAAVEAPRDAVEEPGTGRAANSRSDPETGPAGEGAEAVKSSSVAMDNNAGEENIRQPPTDDAKVQTEAEGPVVKAEGPVVKAEAQLTTGNDSLPAAAMESAAVAAAETFKTKETDPLAKPVGIGQAEDSVGGKASSGANSHLDNSSSSSTTASPSNASSSTSSGVLSDVPPLVSSTKPPPPPPLVPPAALPTHRAVLGVSTASDSAAWYRAAAAGGDPEGMFYLGWAHYKGVGVEENATFARMLWLRSFEVAGIRSSRALAPLLALAGMRIDGWLAPLVGPHALARAHAGLLRGLVAARDWSRGLAASATSTGIGPSSAFDDDNKDDLGWSGLKAGLRRVGNLLVSVGEGVVVAGRWVESLRPKLVAAGAHVDGGNVENTVMLGMLAALLVVLVLRRQRIAART